MQCSVGEQPAAAVEDDGTGVSCTAADEDDGVGGGGRGADDEGTSSTGADEDGVGGGGSSWQTVSWSPSHGVTIDSPSLQSEQTMQVLSWQMK